MRFACGEKGVWGQIVFERPVIGILYPTDYKINIKNKIFLVILFYKVIFFVMKMLLSSRYSIAGWFCMGTVILMQ